MRLWASPYLQYIGRDQADDVRGGSCFSVVTVASGSRWVGNKGANHIILEAVGPVSSLSALLLMILVTVDLS